MIFVCDCSNARAIVSIFPLVGCFPPMTEPSERSFSISFAIADETETQKRAQFRRFSSLLLPTKCSHWPRSIQRNPRKPMQCLSQTFGLAYYCGLKRSKMSHLIYFTSKIRHFNSFLIRAKNGKLLYVVGFSVVK